jgi:hypothetical protein
MPVPRMAESGEPPGSEGSRMSPKPGGPRSPETSSKVARSKPLRIVIPIVKVIGLLISVLASKRKTRKEPEDDQ